MASSQPPPSAKPLIAAITGLPSVSIASKTCCPRLAVLCAPTPDWRDNSAMSAPATNALSPAPVTTTARTPASSRSSSRTACNSSIAAAFRALRRSGRLMVIVATASARAISSCESVIATSDSTLAPPPEDRDEPGSGGAGRCAGRIGGEVVHVSRPSGHEPLMPLVARPVPRRKGHGGEAGPGIPPRPLGARERANQHQCEPAVRRAVAGLVVDTARQRRLGHGGHEENARRIDCDRQPQPEPAQRRPGACRWRRRTHGSEGRLQREGIHQPSEQDGAHHESTEHHTAEAKLLARLILQQ